MATKEFTVKNHLGLATRYIPQRAIYNGVQGHFWERRVLVDGAWVFQGRIFHSLKATRKDIA
jgi:hypothetical protein